MSAMAILRQLSELLCRIDHFSSADRRITYHQKAFQEALEAVGGRYILAYSLEDVLDLTA